MGDTRFATLFRECGQGSELRISFTLPVKVRKILYVLMNVSNSIESDFLTSKGYVWVQRDRDFLHTKGSETTEESLDSSFSHKGEAVLVGEDSG